MADEDNGRAAHQLVLPTQRDDLAERGASLFANALDARRKRLKIYESLKSLNDVIGTQYGDRVLFELVQNAHDAHPQKGDGEIAIRLIIEEECRGMLLVANKGRPFTASNLDALCNIGTSDKQIGEGIGNKGLGFRSVEALTDNVHIFSAVDATPAEEFGGYCFRFATLGEIESGLVASGATADEAREIAPNIPHYLVPVAVDQQSGAVRRLARDGFATVVALPLSTAEAIALARRQVEALIDPAVPVLLFLDRIAGLDIRIEAPEQPAVRRRLARRSEQLPLAKPMSGMTLARITLDGKTGYLVARRSLPKAALFEAIRASLSVAPPLKRWLDWRGDAIVSVAVPLVGSGEALGRLFNFLPMDERAISPIAGHIDAPFFADIDRRAIKADLPLNRHLLDAAAYTAAAAALAIVDGSLDVPEASVVDLAAWAPSHGPRIIGAFDALKLPLKAAEIWPVVSGGTVRWAGFDTLYAWPDVRVRQLTPSRLATAADAAIILSELGEARLSRVKALASAVSLPLTLTEAVLGDWSETIAGKFAAEKKWSPTRWRSLLEDIVALFTAAGLRLSALEGRKILISGDENLIAATARGMEGAPPVFVRVRSGKGRGGDGPPSPPPSLARKFRFVHEGVELGEVTQRAFEKAGLLRRYDALEILGGIKGALGASPTELQRRDALTWAFKVWRAGGGKVVEDALRAAELHAPTLAGWHPIPNALASTSWGPLGRTLEPYLHDAAPISPDCADQRDRLLISFADWPLAATDDRREDWQRFLGVLGLVDGLRPIAGTVRAKGTPSNYWLPLFRTGKADIGLDAAWVERASKQSLDYPQTDFNRKGEVWRLPGQLEHSSLPEAAREALSELIVAYLREQGENQLAFTVEHWRGWEKATLPTPLAVFLREAAWVASTRGDEVAFSAPRNSWSTTAARQPPPRFVARFASEPGQRAGLPAILFDPRIGLRDWSDPASAPQRLAALAGAVDDLSAAERRDLRDQLRRAWHDVADEKLSLPSSLALVVERGAGLDVLPPNPANKPEVHVTSERAGFAARALADRGEALLDVGETNAGTVRDLLEATGGFTSKLADTGDVKLMVNDQEFEFDASDPLLVSGEFAWLADAAVLAHEYLGDAFELRNLPPDQFEQRLRQVRLRRCDSFSLVISGHEVPALGNDRVQPVVHQRVPTLLVTGGHVDLDLLIEAAPALTKLMGARRNTLEQMLNRLMREGYAGSSAGPSEDQYARAIKRDVAIVRDHFAATRGGMERRVHAVRPAVAQLAGLEAAATLGERFDRLGSALDLRRWLVETLGEAEAERCLVAIDDTEDQAVIRRRLGFEFADYGATLKALGYPPLNDEADFRRLFAVYIAERRSDLLNRLRRYFVGVWRAGGDLSRYVDLRRLEFVVFDPRWPLEREELTRGFVEDHANAAIEAAVGADNPEETLPDLDPTVASNRKLVAGRHTKLVGLARAWCRKAKRDRPALMESTDPQPLVRALDNFGLLDFAVLDADDLPALYERVAAWPPGMLHSTDLTALDLEQDDLDYEEREAREAKRKAEAARRTIKFAGKDLDTGDADFSHLFEALADSAIAGDEGWFARSRAPKLLPQEQREPGGGGKGKGGGSGQSWQNQPPEPIRKAMGIASEWLAREYLRRRHPKEMSDACWVSSNRAAFCSGDEGDDGLGYDFRVVTARNEWLYEVKSALDAGGEFELSARELEVAGSASLERKRRYRILYVPFVFEPAQWRVLALSNPAAPAMRNRFRLVRTGSVRYRFETR